MIESTCKNLIIKKYLSNEKYVMNTIIFQNITKIKLREQIHELQNKGKIGMWLKIRYPKQRHFLKLLIFYIQRTS